MGCMERLQCHISVHSAIITTRKLVQKLAERTFQRTGSRGEG